MSIQITHILTILIFFVSLSGFNNRELFARYLYYPFQVWRQGQWYRILTGGFLHANWVHLLVNLFVLWQFGSFLEMAYRGVLGTFGSMVFLAALFLGGIVAANVPALFIHRRNYHFRSIGASGGVSAVLFSYILINPWAKLYLYFVLPLNSLLVGILFLVYSWWASRNRQDQIDHLAHFWGSVYGIIFTVVAYPQSAAIFWEQIKAGLPF